MIGQTVSHYRILEKLGGGGMGVVYKAEDIKLGRLVALKFLREGLVKDPHALERFEREARAASALDHANICVLYEVSQYEGQPFLVMQFLDGQTLEDLIRGEVLTSEQVIKLGIQIADALDTAHGRGIIHRDIKPANIFVTKRGQAKILDFGIAKLLPDELTDVTVSRVSLTGAGGVAGTLPYLAPEVFRGTPADARSDVWSLGVTLYESASGRLPFRGQTGFELTSSILRDAPAALPKHIPPGLQSSIERCLAKEPSQRFQTAGEVRAALEATQTTVVTLPAPAETPSPPRLRWRLWLGLALLAVLAAAWGADVGGWRERLTGGARAPQIRSLAVLPLANLSGDPDQEYFADGMTDALIAELGRVHALRVVSRQSVMRFKGKETPLPEIARELQVDAVMEGSLLQAGGQVRIRAKLIRAAPEKQVWSGSYDRRLSDVLTLTGEVAGAITQEIKVTLTPEERAHLIAQRPVNAEAHQAYMRGRYFWNKRNKEGLEKAMEQFRQAIKIDPNFAPAYAGLADCYLVAWDGGFLPADLAYQEAKTAATRAVQLDDTLAEAHASLGSVLSIELSWPAVEQEYKRAIELNPGYATAHQWYAIYLTQVGRHAEAIAEAKRAIELDPLSLIISTFLGSRHYFAGQYDQAIQQLRKTLEMDSQFSPALVFLGQAYVQKGMYAEAIQAFQKAIALRVDAATGDLGHAYALAGEKNQARKILGQLLKQSKKHYVAPYMVALVYVGLGENEEAIGWVNRAYEERPGILVLLKVDPRFRPLHSLPRFVNLIRHSGLPLEESSPPTH